MGPDFFVEYNANWQAKLEAAVAAEREACAKIAANEEELRTSNSEAAKNGSHEWGEPEHARMVQGHKAITAGAIRRAILARGNN